MDTIESLRCTICGSHHLTKINENEYCCDNCNSVISKKKAEDYEKIFKKIKQEGIDFDIENIRRLIDMSLEGRINKQNLVKYCSDLLRYLPDDILANFYMKYVNRKIDPDAYVECLNEVKNEASISEFNKIKDIIINSVQKREEKIVREVFKRFYGNKYENEITNSLKRRVDEIELFSNIRRDVFICHSSHDRKTVDEVLKILEEDGNTCWVSFRNIPYDSDNYWKNIEDAIKSCDIFLCVSSQYTNQSEDCRREVEIAKMLDKKKRMEYKIDDSRDITLFRNFFTGQWITNIDDLPQRVYEIKYKEKKLEETALKLLNNGEYKKAKEKYLEIKEYSNNSNIDDQISLCLCLLTARDLIKENMFSEAKAKLLSINNIQYTKELLDVCNKKLKETQQIAKLDVNEIKLEPKTINSEGLSIDSLEKRAYVFLDDGNWKKADEYAEKILDIDANLPYGYIIKLLALNKVNSIEKLGNLTIKEFSDDSNYKKALYYSTGEINKKLTKVNCINNYKKGLTIFKKISKKEDYTIAAAFFKNAYDYKDAKEYYQKCLDLAKEYDIEKKYKMALEQSSEEKIKSLKEIIEYKDSKELMILEINKLYTDICSLPINTRLYKLNDFKQKYGDYKNVDSEINETKESIKEEEYRKAHFAAIDRRTSASDILRMLTDFKNLYGSYKDIDIQIERIKEEIKEIEYNKACTADVTQRYSMLASFKKTYGKYKDINKKMQEAHNELMEYDYQALSSLTGEQKINKLKDFKEKYGSYKDVDDQIKRCEISKNKKKITIKILKILGLLLGIALLGFDILLTISIDHRFFTDGVPNKITLLYIPFISTLTWLFIQIIVKVSSFKVKISTVRIISTIISIIFAIIRVYWIGRCYFLDNDVTFINVIIFLAISFSNALPYIIQIIWIKQDYIGKMYGIKTKTSLKIYICLALILVTMVFDIWVTFSLRLSEMGACRWIFLPLIGAGLNFAIVFFIRLILEDANTKMFTIFDRSKFKNIIAKLVLIVGIIRGFLIVTGSYLVTDNFIFYPELGQFIINMLIYIFYSYVLKGENK